VPYITLALTGIVLVAQLLMLKPKKYLSRVVVLAVMSLMLFSNQFTLARQVGNGAIDQEFKNLAEWYSENGNDEKMVTTMPHVVSLFLLDKRDRFVHFQYIEGQTPQEFIQNCYKRNIKYIAWDSRIGLSPRNTYYKRWKMKRVTFLGPRMGENNTMVAPPKQMGPFERVMTIQNDFYPNRFIYVYKLHQLSSDPAKVTPG
jgi:hypothetical protein